MKKTKLKKQTKKGLESIGKKLDREYQDLFRELCREYDIKCEVSGIEMNVIHHFIKNKRSGYLRYNLINFVPLSNGSHCAIHTSYGDGGVINKIFSKRGKEWSNEIDRLKDITISKDWKYYSDARCQLEWIKEHRKEVADSYFKYGYFNVVNK